MNELGESIMSSPIVNDPFIEMLRDENSKKARGQKNPFSNNPRACW